MHSKLRAAAIALASLALAAGCPADKTDATNSNPTTPKLTLTRTAATITANGTSTSTITVSGGKTAPITVYTDRGTLTGGGQSATIAGTSGSVTLTSCNALTTSNCVGAALIDASDAAGTTGSTTVTFTSSEICDNLVDDDGDSLVDCKDIANCAVNQACDASGHVCAPDGTCTKCGGGGGTAETAESSCNDGFDNDCDGDADCADSDCAGQACVAGAVYGTCQSGSCTCDKTESTELSCGDGVDNDCDGKVDCADPNCMGKLCDASLGLACGGTPVSCSVCQSGQTTELATQCGDGKDNDCDGKTDCDDSDCASDACNAFGGVCTASTTGSTCACPSGKFAETNCSDGIDDDCNGKVDCADPNCDLQQCGATTAFVCEVGACVDQKTKYSVALTAGRSRLPAVANAETEVTVEVKYLGEAAQGRTILLSVDDQTLGNVTPVSVYTDSYGKATFTFIASGDVGIATITAEVDGPGTTGTLSIEMPALGEIRLASVQYPVMGVKHSGFQEQDNLAVELLDMEGRPYPDGLTVRFEHMTLGGSTLSGTPLADVAGICEAPWCVRTNSRSDASGVASVTLYSGTLAGTVSVTASSGAGGLPERVFDIPTVAIIGARANGAHLSVVCDPLNIPALTATTCYTSLIDAPFTCKAVLKDRFNNIVGRETAVTFMSEAGAVGQPATTPPYDPTKDPVSQADLGIALEVINTLGNKLPKDVPPHDGTANPYGATLAKGDPRWEYSLSYDDMKCLPGTHNPRDGVVTVVASTPGEEAFFDANGNGVYDAEPCTDLDGDGIWCETGEFTDIAAYGHPGVWDSEPFIDLPEPYLDYNDDNTRNADEPFIDSNGNGKWDPPNGKWDFTAKIWTQTRVVYTSAPRADAYTDANQRFSRWMTVADYVTFPSATPTPVFTMSLAAGTEYLDVLFALTDDNFNTVAKNLGLSVVYTDYTAYGGYFGDPATLDKLGFTFVYWPCDAADTTKCANDCAYATTTGTPPARCVMRSVIRGYQYGVSEPVRLFPLTSADTQTLLFMSGSQRFPATVITAP